MTKYLILIILTACQIYSQTEYTITSGDTVSILGKTISDSFPDWVLLWKKQNQEFDLSKMIKYYDEVAWKLDMTWSPESTKYMNKLDSSRIKISPNGTKYIRLCGFCAYELNKDGVEENVGEYHGYMTYADLKNWKERNVLFWSFMAPIIDGKWLDNDKFVAIGEQPDQSMVRPYYYYIDTKNKFNILLKSQVLCAPLGKK